MKVPITRFHDNPFSWSRADIYGQTDIHLIAPNSTTEQLILLRNHSVCLVLPIPDDLVMLSTVDSKL